MTYRETVEFIKSNLEHKDTGKICEEGGFCRQTLKNSMKRGRFEDLSKKEKVAIRFAATYLNHKKQQTKKEAEEYQAEISKLCQT